MVLHAQILLAKSATEHRGRSIRIITAFNAVLVELFKSSYPHQGKGEQTLSLFVDYFIY